MARSSAPFVSSSTLFLGQKTPTVFRSSYHRIKSTGGMVLSLFFSGVLGSFCIVLDIYIAMVSSTHNVCAKEVFVAIVSTIVETDRPEQEIAPGLRLLGPIHEKYDAAFRRRSATYICTQIRHGLTPLHPDLEWQGRQRLYHSLVRCDEPLRDCR